MGGDYLEIGCYYGVFISELARKHPNIKLFGIEPFVTEAYDVKEDQKESLQQEVKEFFKYNTSGLNNIIHWEKKTEECLKKEYINQLTNVGCILIDGSHHYSDILVDIKFIKKINNIRNILIVFDDIHIGDVYNAVGVFKEEFKSRIILEKEYNNCSFFIISPKV